MKSRPTANRTTLVILSALLAAATLVVYWQVRSHDFIDYDDGQYIFENPSVQHGMTMESIRWAFTSGYAANWHPLTWMSHMLDVSLYGLNPTGHHLTNVFLHTITSILLFWVFYRMTADVWPSAFIAVVFAIHPLHVESVAWAAERKDVLCALFWILTMGAYHHYVRRPGVGRYILVGLFLVLGLLSKPMIVTLPFVLLLMDYWPLARYREAQSQPMKRERGREQQPARQSTLLGLVREKVPLFMLVAASSIITFLVQQRGGAVSSVVGLPMSVRIGNALVAYFEYLKNTVWPQGLGVMYPHPGKMPPLDEVFVGGAVMVAITGLVLWQARKRRYLFAGWLWFVGTLVPVIGIVQVGRQAFADRYMYIPIIGLAIMVAWGTLDLAATLKGLKRLIPVASIVAVAAMCVMTWRQVGYWQDGESLFRHTLDVTDNNYLAITNYGIAVHKKGKVQEAFDLYQKALTFDQSYEIAHYNLGLADAHFGRMEEAEKHFLEAIRINPTYVEARNNLGIVYASTGRPGKAIEQFNAALQTNPNSVDAHHNMGLVLTSQGKYQEAIVQLSRALELDPNKQSTRVALERARQLQKPRL